MNNLHIRPATLADAAAITAVHCSAVEAWRDPVTRKPVPYEALGLYGRWYNGGPWMSVETCAVHLNGLLAQGHVPLVAEYQGQVVGEAEYYINREVPPYGPHLHLSVLYIHKKWQRQGVGKALLAAGVRRACALDMCALTTQPEPEASDFYRRAGFRPWLRAKEMQFPAGGVTPPGLAVMHVPAAFPAHLPQRIGRYQCGRQGWDALWPTLMLPGWSDLRRKVWQGHVEGVPVVLGLREQVRDKHQADGYAWLPSERVLVPVVAALRALGAELGFGAVDMLIPVAALEKLRQTFRMDYQTSVALWKRDLSP